MMTLRIKKNNRTLLIAFALLIGAGLLYAFPAHGATSTWDGGGGDANWNTAANWSSDTAPTASDIATFDGTCASNCSPTVNVAISVAGINMAADYAGTITQSTTNAITVGSSHWVQASGTFTGGSGAITVNGTFTLSGGTFTSTTGTLQVGRYTAIETFFTVSGGTFTHSSGTVEFVENYNGNQGDTKTVNVVTSLTLYNIIIDPGTADAITAASGDTIIAANDFTIYTGTVRGSWEFQGNVTISSGASQPSSYAITPGTLTYTGTGSKVYTYASSGTGPHLRVNTATGSLSPNTGTTELKVALFSLLAGTFTAPTGTMTVGRSMHTETFFTVSGGTFTHSSGTVKFAQYYNGSCNGNVITVDVATSLTLYDIIIDAGSGADCIRAASGDTIIAANDFTITGGGIVGAWEVQGNIIIGVGADSISYPVTVGTLTYTGTGSKTYTYTAGGTGPHLRVNTASGSLSANAGTTDLSVDNFSLLAGAFTAPTGTLTVGRLMNIETFFTVSGGTFTHSSGTVKFDEYYNGSCSDAKTIDVATSFTLYNIIIDEGSYADCLTVAAGDTLIAANNFTVTGGAMKGSWEVQGNMIIGSGADGGTGTLSFTGSNDQTYTDQGGNEPDGDIIINKTSGTVTLASNADWNAASQDLAITSGTLSSATYNIATVNFTVNGGTFTGGSGTVTTSGPMLVSSGTFTGGAGNITVNSTFTLSGGTFTSTSGTLTLNFSGSSATIVTISGGTFNHNNGTVNFSPGEMNYLYTVNVTASLTLYNAIVSVTSFGAGYLIATGNTIVVANNFTQTDGRLNGTWQVEGNVTIASTADGGDGTLTMTGTGSKTYTYSSGGTGPHLRVNNAALSVAANTGTTALTITGLSVLAGTFTAPTGTLTIDFSGGTATVFTVSSGTFNHSSGTVNFSPGDANYVYTVDVATSLTLYNVIVTASGNGAAQLTAAAGDTIIVANNFTHTDGLLNGIWQIQGNATIAAAADGGNATLAFTGTNSQTYTDQGGNEPDGDITINKTSGTVTLASNADWNATSQDLTITSGTLNTGGFIITGPGTGALSVANSATLIMSGASPYPVSYGSYTYGTTSTVRYAQTITTTTVATTYGHLEVMPGANDITHTFPTGTTVVSGNLTLGNGTNTGAIVTAATNATTLDVNGTTTVATNTTFVANNANPLTIAGNFTNSGTFTAGTGTTTFDGASAQTIEGSMTGASAFGNVVMSGAGEKSFSNAASTTNFSILSGASVVAPSALTVIGNLSNDGTFTANGGLVTLTGTNQTISTVATTTFYSLTKRVTATDTLTFTAGKEYEFAGTLTLSGTAGNLLLLRSSASGTYWYLDPQASTSLTYVNAKDSNNVNVTTVNCNTGCIDGTGNINWSFEEQVSAATISSAAVSSFYVGQATTTLSTVTITEDPTTPSIASTTDLRIVISTTTTNFRFDTNTTSLTFGGTASGKVASTVSYENDGAVLMIDVTSNFTASDTLMISDIAVGSFASVSSSSSYLTLQTDGNSTGTPAATDTATIYLTGLLTLSDHVLGQVNNEFSFQNKTDTTFFAFNLEALGENATVTDLVITLAEVQGIDADNFTNFRLYRDNNSNLGLDGDDTELDTAGILTINEQAGAITFSSDFIATTSADYLMIANTSDINVGESVILRLAAIGVTAVGDLSLYSPYIVNTLESVQHHRGGVGAGGTAARIGDTPPAGAGVVTGGGNSGGAGADTVPDGENITSDSDFFKPTNTGTPDNEWTNGTNAYDSDGVYATAASTNLKQSYANFGFGIPTGNTIQGLAVKLDLSGTTADGTVDVSISWDGGSSYTTAKATPTVSGNDVVYTVGGNADTWGRTWNESEFSAENFRLRVSAQPAANTIRLDALEIRVFHQTGGGGAGGGVGGGRI